MSTASVSVACPKRPSGCGLFFFFFFFFASMIFPVALPLYTLGIGLGDFVSGHAGGGVHFQRNERLPYPGRADDVHPNFSALELERRGTAEAF